MQRCISVSFEFKGTEFYAIVRRRAVQEKTNYKIRVMNHRLDSLLHKHNANLLEEIDGRLVLAHQGSLGEAAEVQLAIAKQLSLQLSGDESNRGYAVMTDFRLLTPY